MAEKIWIPKSKYDLMKLINADISLSCIDTSLIIDMSRIFELDDRDDFSGIEKWNVSNVTDMSYMFYNASSFNININSWDTSSVTNMSGMFSEAESFNQPLGKWNVANVENMSFMFYAAVSFNQNLDSWNIREKVINHSIFEATQLEANQTLPKWFQKFLAKEAQKES